MKTHFFYLIALIFCFAGISASSAQESGAVEITILYDNYIFTEGLDLKSDWGFACIIDGAEKRILFDTGTKGDILVHNIKQLDVDLKNTELIIISHNHGDHMGGLPSIIESSKFKTIYIPGTEPFLPAESPQLFFSKMRDLGISVRYEPIPVEICKDVWLTGIMGTQTHEQSLVFNTDKGLVVLTGCAHPGIVDIVKKAKEIVNKDVYLVFGGFHLMSHSEEQVNEIIDQFRKLGVMKVGATHCTGDKAIDIFKKAFGENFVKIGIGKVVKF